ncbi:MAG: DUF2793 domain-containing protein, partial [Candidatus Devosia symbiotica]|nr:DUF2793 domain-containing protein [Candidatus Devosia symbiotica]
LYCKSDQSQLVFDGAAWEPLASLGNVLPRLGIDISADGANRLAVASEASLLTHAGEAIISSGSKGDVR